MLHAGGPLGRVLRRQSALRATKRGGDSGGESPDVFPLPPLLAAGGSARQVGPEVCGGALSLTNLWVAILNFMYMGREEDAVGKLPASAAQGRILQLLLDRAMSFLSAAGAPPRRDSIREYLKVAGGYEPARGTAEPLGESGGVPPVAADVSLYDVLLPFDPQLAATAVEPTRLLLPKGMRPPLKRTRRPLLAPSYRNLVMKNVKAGLQTLVHPRRVWRHQGRIMLGGCFGIAKSPTEQRVISDLPVNDLFDPQLVPRPQFAYTPRLRTLVSSRGREIVVRRRDARH